MKRCLLKVSIDEEWNFHQYITQEAITGGKVKTKSPGWFILILSMEQLCFIRLKFNPWIQYAE